MTTENREISITANANQAVRQLSLAGNALDQLGTAVGKTDRELRQFDRAVSNSGNAMRNAQSAIVGMRDKINQLDREARASDVTIRAMGRTMDRQAEATRTATAALEASRAKIREQKREITSLNTEVNALVRKIDQLEQVNRELAQNFDKLKNSTKEAESGLLQYGAAATQSLTRLKALEVQMDAIKGKQLSQLNLPTSLGGGSAQQFLRNPDTNAISSMSNANLAQISQAYAIQTRSLREMVDRELTNRFASNLGFDADSLDFSNALRYQLYDVAGLFGVIGAAATGLSVAFLGVGIAWEKNFANVERTSQTTGAAVEALRQDFLELQSVVPVTAAELAEIGTLGAQMGVAAADLARFTDITSKFASTAGIGVDEAATALSRLDQLLPDVEGNYNRLASAILLTGVNAVATEQQIVRGTGQIASIAQIAGLATPEIIALASSLSSLGFSPELQRSIVTSSFSKILTATTQVTAQTEKYGAVLGITGKQFQEAWRTDAIGTYRDLLQNIATRGDAVSVLQDLGLASQRLTPNLLKLGQNVEVLDAALADTEKGWKEQTELTRQYDITASTVAAKIQVMGQAWEALVVTLGDSDGVLSDIISFITEMLRGLQRMASSPGLSTITTIAAVIGTIAGVGALAAAGLALATGGYIALVNANVGLNAALASNTASTAANTAVRGVATGGLAAHTTATNVNTGAVVANDLALKSGALSAVKWSGNLISSIPSILKWGGIATAAILGVAGAFAIYQDASNINYDVRKFTQGIDTPTASIDFAIKNIKERSDALEEATKSAEAARKSQQESVFAANSSLVSLMAGADVKLVEEMETAYRDLQDSILDLNSSEAQLDAINIVSRELGITQEELLTKMPDLASGLGDQAAQAALAREEIEQLDQATELWAAHLGFEGVEAVAAFQEKITSAASSFFDFGTALSDAYAEATEDTPAGGGLSQFIAQIDEQIIQFETFSGRLSELTQRGGLNLAGFFAEQGPSAMQALTDSLELSPEQLAQVEDQMSLAAFYASEEFANAFTQNNAILVDVFRQSGGNRDAVAAYNSALNAALAEGVSIDAATLAGLNAQFGVNIDANVVPSIDPAVFEEEVLQLKTIASAEKITFYTSMVDDQGRPYDQAVDSWRIEEAGNVLTIPVDPNTEEGGRLIRAWRDNEYANPLLIRTDLDAAAAYRSAEIIRQRISAPITIRLLADATGFPTAVNRPVLRAGQIAPYATGGLIKSDLNSLPAFATGGQYGQFRGPGTGTSDSILARVSNGEFINTARSVAYYGTQFFDDLNRMRIPRYAVGGMVGPGGSGGSGASVNVEVNQYYPTTQDPIAKLREDAESVIAGIWT